jgi:hypothetical protein
MLKPRSNSHSAVPLFSDIAIMFGAQRAAAVTLRA